MKQDRIDAQERLERERGKEREREKAFMCVCSFMKIKKNPLKKRISR